MIFNHSFIDKDALSGKGLPIQLGDTARRALVRQLAAGNQTTTKVWLQKHLPGRSGMHGLHWQCGSGEDTFLVASLLDQGSTVLGIDADPVQIEAARRQRAEAGMAKLCFNHSAKLSADYDFIYSRFWIGAVGDLERTLGYLGQHLKPDGVLLAEVILFSTISAYPYNHAFGRSVHLMSSLEIRTPDVQKTWSKLYREAGFRPPEVVSALPCFLPRQSNSLLSLSLEFFRETLLHRRMVEREELNALLLELRQYEQQEDTLIGRPGVWQLVAGRI